MGTESMDGMLQLAAEAFQSKNFELAADIYECQLLLLSDPATQQDLLLKRADALAFSGKLSEAFEIYQKASEFDRLRPVQLENLIECLSSTTRRKDGSDSQNNQQHVDCAADCGGCDVFACGICFGFLYEPVTLPCGHCFCKKCLERENKPVCCKDCKESSNLTDVHNYRVNVVLSNLISKWFPSQLIAITLRREGNVLYAEKRMEAALEKYNEAIQIAPRDHVLYSNRSQINSSLKSFEDALSDATVSCRLKPLWVKGRIRRAQALSSLGKTDEALAEYLLCMALDPESKLAKTEAQKLLSDLLTPVTDHMQKKILDCTSLLSSRPRIKGNITTTPSSGCMASPRPYKDCKNHLNSRLHLKEILRASPTNSLKNTDHASERDSCSKGKGEDGDEGLPNVCHPTVIDRSLLKRKHSTEEDSKPGSNEVTCKHAKPEKLLRRVEESSGLREMVFLSDGGQKEGETMWSDVVAEHVDLTDLECSLCMRLFYEPTTTPCGHTFCLKCLERCLDHNPKCPLCKEDLSKYLAQRRYCKTVLMEHLICKYLPAELVDRQQANQEEVAELSNLNKNVPIFVCTIAFPTVPCPLHIFEPCYRLMIRRCMETGTRQFGMCLADSLKGFADYGCLLEIRNVEFFADGRSVVDTIGKRRFKVSQHSQRDGYNTADIEYLEDVKVEGPADADLRTLHDTVYDLALVWVNSLRAEQKERILGHFGSIPDKDSDPQASPNGPSWCWWLLAVLPLEARAQLPFLALTALKDRLTGIRRVLLFMSRNRSR